VRRTIRDKLGVNENFWLDSMYMMQIIEEYNHTKLYHFKDFDEVAPSADCALYPTLVE
jgi:hypothetical protein